MLCYSFQRHLSWKKGNIFASLKHVAVSAARFSWLFSWFVFFGLHFKYMHYRCNKGSFWERSWTSQYMRITFVYSILAMSTEMQWIVWCNIKMWFIFIVNAKSFNFATVHFHVVLGLQISKLWIIQIVHNNKSVVSYTEMFLCSLNINSA